MNDIPPYLAELIRESAFDNEELQEDIEELEEMRFSYIEKAEEIAEKHGIKEDSNE